MQLATLVQRTASWRDRDKRGREVPGQVSRREGMGRSLERHMGQKMTNSKKLLYNMYIRYDVISIVQIHIDQLFGNMLAAS